MLTINHYTISYLIYSFSFRSRLTFFNVKSKVICSFSSYIFKNVKDNDLIVVQFSFLSLQSSSHNSFLSLPSLHFLLDFYPIWEENVHLIIQSKWTPCFSLNVPVMQQMPLVLKFCNCCHWQSNTTTLSPI